MRNWKTLGIASIIVVVTATVGALAYAPVGSLQSQTSAIAPHAATMSYAPAHKDPLHTRVAQSCIAHGDTCTINGTSCCNAADSCKGTFPNTTCQ